MKLSIEKFLEELKNQSIKVTTATIVKTSSDQTETVKACEIVLRKNVLNQNELYAVLKWGGKGGITAQTKYREKSTRKELAIYDSVFIKVNSLMNGLTTYKATVKEHLLEAENFKFQLNEKVLLRSVCLVYYTMCEDMFNNEDELASSYGIPFIFSKKDILARLNIQVSRVKGSKPPPRLISLYDLLEPYNPKTPTEMDTLTLEECQSTITKIKELVNVTTKFKTLSEAVKALNDPWRKAIKVGKVNVDVQGDF